MSGGVWSETANWGKEEGVERRRNRVELSQQKARPQMETWWPQRSGIESSGRERWDYRFKKEPSAGRLLRG